MKNGKTQLTAILFVVALALAPIIQAAPAPDGGPTHPVVNDAPRPDGGPNSLAANEAAARPTPAPRARPIAAPRPEGSPVNLLADERVSANSEAIPEGENRPIITVHSTDSVIRGKTGSFVLNMNPRMFGGLYVNFALSGSAVAGVDYVQPLSPAYIGQSGYGVILIQTLANPRGLANRQSYSVVVKLDTGAGYALGIPNSATMWIKP